MINHILKLREHQVYATAVIFLGIEVNQGGWVYAERFAKLFQPDFNDSSQMYHHKRLTGGKSLGRIVIYNKDPHNGGNPGVWTGVEQKVGGAELLLESLRRGNLRFAREFVTQHQSPDSVKDKILKQMAKFRKQPKALKDPAFQKPGWVLTGKSGKDKDDIVVCIQMNMYWKHRNRDAEFYKRICAEYGLRAE